MDEQPDSLVRCGQELEKMVARAERACLYPAPAHKHVTSGDIGTAVHLAWCCGGRLFDGVIRRIEQRVDLGDRFRAFSMFLRWDRARHPPHDVVARNWAGPAP